MVKKSNRMKIAVVLAIICFALVILALADFSATLRPLDVIAKYSPSEGLSITFTGISEIIFALFSGLGAFYYYAKKGK